MKRSRYHSYANCTFVISRLIFHRQFAFFSQTNRPNNLKNSYRDLFLLAQRPGLHTQLSTQVDEIYIIYIYINILFICTHIHSFSYIHTKSNRISM
ncbi:uncharacterized protein FA14DRAFT_30528 [Meira miltonrushii]|uniref:Uncharacterized protein n=1 Tax=Meira miltonrushii TaxID=1280837 RepID=A0A316V2K1_9BASI|nr:uncharacterized protein FA14DRAFT_30528 [Meira miltonrushii]PWN31228.1 hypothetical protein FA14DRAFT_30528 [Meira miltonrushii]